MSHLLRDVIRILQAATFFIVAAAATGAVVYTGLCVLGLADWLQMTVQLGATPYPAAGVWLQGGLTALLAAMALYLPGHARIMALERSHRSFHISMADVARAYDQVHAADRAGVFTLSSEFDAVRERLAYLRDHPDLAQLENGVMEVSAQMSVQSRHLAEVYSNARVARAKAFLQQRQQAAEDQQARIVEALHICDQINTWAQQVELEEARVTRQLAYLDDRLQATLPLLGYALEHDATLDGAPATAAPDRAAGQAAPTNIVPLPQKPAAE